MQSSILERTTLYAFSGCWGLTKLISNAATSPTCGSQALDDINKWTCTLQVPDSSVSLYQAAPQWKEFFFIEDIPTGISTVKTGSTPLHEDVYGIDGRSRQTIQRGINIIRSSDGTTKKVLQR